MTKTLWEEPSFKVETVSTAASTDTGCATFLGRVAPAENGTVLESLGMVVGKAMDFVISMAVDVVIGMAMDVVKGKVVDRKFALILAVNTTSKQPMVAQSMRV